jgi:lipopolysaccharide export system protein LptA
VIMKDKDGNQIRGKRAVYAMDTGKVEVKGQDPNAPATPAATPAVTPAPAAVHHPGSGG